MADSEDTTPDPQKLTYHELNNLADRLYSRGVSAIFADQPTHQADLRLASSGLRLLASHRGGFIHVGGREPPPSDSKLMTINMQIPTDEALSLTEMYAEAAVSIRAFSVLQRTSNTLKALRYDITQIMNSTADPTIARRLRDALDEEDDDD
jgi:hypothetical protein